MNAPGPRKAAYLLFAALLAASAACGLAGVLLAGLFSYMVLDLSHRALSRRLPAAAARWAALTAFLLVAAGLGWAFVSFATLALVRLPEIVDGALPALEAAARERALPLPVEELRAPREWLLGLVAENAGRVTLAGVLLTKGFFQFAVAMAAAVLFFMNPRGEAAQGAGLYGALRLEFGARVRRFMEGFELVIGAQVLISAINAVLTAIFLLAIGMPYVPFLVLAAFILGLLPIVGNIMSNFIIVGTALTVSLWHAALSLAYLVAIHTLEHFLNSKIIGGTIRAPMWLTLLGIMLGEAVLGMPGIVLAPAVIHYARAELRALPA